MNNILFQNSIQKLLVRELEVYFFPIILLIFFARPHNLY